MNVAETIRRKLTTAFDPVELEVIDDSESHRGHAGFREGGETHFNVRIIAKSFAGLSRIAQQRAVYEVLKEEMAGQIHALSLDIKAIS
ncbi:MAG: BolA family transcriptional regulator [Rhodobacteraceae bacterium]|nr:BolA family transcriptional regulator [Paracoccaceae bacterium]